jgi:hypothetical protein
VFRSPQPGALTSVPSTALLLKGHDYIWLNKEVLGGINCIKYLCSYLFIYLIHLHAYLFIEVHIYLFNYLFIGMEWNRVHYYWSHLLAYYNSSEWKIMTVEPLLEWIIGREIDVLGANLS